VERKNSHGQWTVLAGVNALVLPLALGWAGRSPKRSWW
jgi:hypothetical protein